MTLGRLPHVGLMLVLSVGLGAHAGAIPPKRPSPKAAHVPTKKRGFAFRDMAAYVGRYFERRVMDAADILQAQTSWGIGVSADAEVLGLLHVGTGASRERACGFEGRELIRRSVVRAGVPFGNVYHACRRDGRYFVLHERHERSLRYPSVKTEDACYWVLPVLANASPKWQRPHWWRQLRVEAGGFAGLLGARVGVHLGEAFDFVVGIFGADPAGDDLPAP